MSNLVGAMLVRPQAATLASTNVTENDYPAYSSGTTYGEGDRIIVVADHMVYESLVGSNLNHTPASSPTFWIPVWPTNPYRMLDQAVQSQTTRADNITASLTVDGTIDWVSLFNISAASAHVTLTDAVEGVVYDETVNLVSDSGITDWYAYFFEPIARKRDLHLELPVYANPTLSVVLTDTGETAALGGLIPGLSRTLGGTQWGVQVGIRDYSRKEESEFGDFTVLQRAYSRWANFSVHVEPGFVDELVNVLADYRATPAIWVADSEYASTVVYGFYDDFQVEISYPTLSACSLRIKGLT
jgi:hypothetical protein